MAAVATWSFNSPQKFAFLEMKFAAMIPETAPVKVTAMIAAMESSEETMVYGTWGKFSKLTATFQGIACETRENMVAAPVSL